ncbi:hypothetical protein E2C01_039848 [Portunus trituberculatus]|uniref:Uncharacterized protein n=1 Tax=Portunus trituberculatus TaxID=210409 RepID=A0A5B7FLS1_PORTR|nr:hypothetical protein [Portunus trituberculatus]
MVTPNPASESPSGLFDLGVALGCVAYAAQRLTGHQCMGFEWRCSSQRRSVSAPRNMQYCAATTNRCMI